MPLPQVAPSLVSAVLSAEDAHFFEHHGIDWDAVETARAWNRAHAGDRRRRLRGASTLTQQLAKNLWLTGERTWWRKGREAASRTLFGLSASRLSVAQAARLAALIPGPAWYRAHPAAWERRAALIERRLEGEPPPGGLTAPAR